MYDNNNIMFGSSFTQNQMLDIYAESDIVRARDEADYQSPIENVPSGATAYAQQHGRTRRRSHSRRHTRAQIQELEAFFLNCPHPNEKQRKDLSRVLGLEPQQVRFWFQNKQTKLRAQRESDVNRILKAENAKLRAEISAYKEALSNHVQSCTKCGNLSTIFFEDQLLRNL